MAAGTTLTTIGGCLQLLGLGVAGAGVRNVRRLRSDRLGVWGSLKALAPRHLFRRRPPIFVEAIAAADTAHARARAENARVKAGPPQDAELREQFVLGELSWLREAVGDLREYVAAEVQEREAALVRLGDLLTETSAVVRAEINVAMTEGLTQQTAGLVCAALGAVLTIIGAAIS